VPIKVIKRVEYPSLRILKPSLSFLHADSYSKSRGYIFRVTDCRELFFLFELTLGVELKVYPLPLIRKLFCFLEAIYNG